MITFKNSAGDTFTGRQIWPAGFECIDLVLVQNGFICEVYELATGMKLIDTCAFTETHAMHDLNAIFKKKRSTPEKLLEKIHQVSKHPFGRSVDVVNHSPAYEAFCIKKAEEVDALPYAYNENERCELLKMAELARAAGNEELANVMMVKYEMKTNSKVIIDFKLALSAFDRAMTMHRARLLRFEGRVVPETLRIDFKPWQTDWQDMVEQINWGRKRDISKYIPAGLMQAFYQLYVLLGESNNRYGYRRFCSGVIVSLMRMGIDIKMKRDVRDDAEAVLQQIKADCIAVRDETQPYVIEPHEQYLFDKWKGKSEILTA